MARKTKNRYRMFRSGVLSASLLGFVPIYGAIHKDAASGSVIALPALSSDNAAASQAASTATPAAPTPATSAATTTQTTTSSSSTAAASASVMAQARTRAS